MLTFGLIGDVSVANVDGVNESVAIERMGELFIAESHNARADSVKRSGNPFRNLAANFGRSDGRGRTRTGVAMSTPNGGCFDGFGGIFHL